MLEARMKSVRFLALLITVAGLAVLPLNAATTGHFERTLQVNGTVELEVSSGSGNITVHQGGAGSVAITAKIHGNNGTSWLFGSGNVEERIHKIEQNPPVVQQGNTIRVGRIEDRELTKNISIDYDVTVPPQTRLTSHTGSGDQMISGLQLPMTAKTGSGNVTVDHISAETRVSSGSGDLKINSVKGVLYAETGSGNIHAEDIAGDVFANTGSGNVEVRQTGGGSVKAQTGSGNIRLHGVKGGLRADAGSGDIQAEGEPTQDWRLGAGSGNITLRVPAQASFNIDARTSSGSLKVNHPFTMQGSVARNHIQGKVGNGGVLLDVHTGSGDIEVE
jgi:Putative adhesin